MAYVATGSTPQAGELESINSHHPLDSDNGKGDGIAMGFGIDAGMAAARFMFDIIKKYYLVKVFPECARNLQLIKDDGKGMVCDRDLASTFRCRTFRTIPTNDSTSCGGYLLNRVRLQNMPANHLEDHHQLPHSVLLG